MLKKTFNIIVIAVLALNLMGAWAFASLLDCGMECCKPGEWAGTTSYEAPSCCQMNDVTCGFETGHYEELFDKAICCFNSTSSHHLTTDDLTIASTINLPGLSFNHTGIFLKEHPPSNAPVYLSKAAFLC